MWSHSNTEDCCVGETSVLCDKNENYLFMEVSLLTFLLFNGTRVRECQQVSSSPFWRVVLLLRCPPSSNVWKLNLGIRWLCLWTVLPFYSMELHSCWRLKHCPTKGPFLQDYSSFDGRAYDNAAFLIYTWSSAYAQSLLKTVAERETSAWLLDVESTLVVLRYYKCSVAVWLYIMMKSSADSGIHDDELACFNLMDRNPYFGVQYVQKITRNG